MAGMRRQEVPGDLALGHMVVDLLLVEFVEHFAEFLLSTHDVRAVVAVHDLRVASASGKTGECGEE